MARSHYNYTRDLDSLHPRKGAQKARLEQHRDSGIPKVSKDDEERELLEQIREHIDRIKAEVGVERTGIKAKNIAIVGHVGAGKSAFVNTLIAALSQDRWKEKAYTGHHGEDPRAITTNMTV